MSWTQDRVDLLKKLWGEGKTAAEIAHTLGGVTRNAVIGKAHRLKLSNRVAAIQQNKKPVKAQAPANNSIAPEKKSPPAKILKNEVFPEEGKSMADLNARECRWPYGDPREENFCFCAGPAIEGLPYCIEHAQVAYQPATRNRILKAEDFEERASKDDAAEMKESISA